MSSASQNAATRLSEVVNVMMEIINGGKDCPVEYKLEAARIVHNIASDLNLPGDD